MPDLKETPEIKGLPTGRDCFSCAWNGAECIRYAQKTGRLPCVAWAELRYGKETGNERG